MKYLFFFNALRALYRKISHFSLVVFCNSFLVQSHKNATNVPASLEQQVCLQDVNSAHFRVFLGFTMNLLCFYAAKEIVFGNCRMFSTLFKTLKRMTHLLIAAFSLRE